MMNYSKIKLNLIAATLLLFIFVSFVTVCVAQDNLIAIGNENAQMNFYGNEVGVYYVITDPNGRRVGYDSVTKQYVEEFPASFGFSFEVRDEISDKFNGEAMFNLIPGDYTIEVIGIGLTTFSLDAGISRRITGIESFYFNGITDKGLTSKFHMAYNSDPSKPAGSVTRVATPGSLKQDITLLRKIGRSLVDIDKYGIWIDNDGVMTSLLKKAEAIEASIQKDRKKTTENLIKAFINEVNAQAEKHISKEAVKMLTEDAEYMMHNL